MLHWSLNDLKGVHLNLGIINSSIEKIFSTRCLTNVQYGVVDSRLESSTVCFNEISVPGIRITLRKNTNCCWDVWSCVCWVVIDTNKNSWFSSIVKLGAILSVCSIKYWSIVGMMKSFCPWKIWKISRHEHRTNCFKKCSIFPFGNAILSWTALSWSMYLFTSTVWANDFWVSVELCHADQLSRSFSVCLVLWGCHHFDDCESYCLFIHFSFGFYDWK